MPANRKELAALFVEYGLDAFLNSTRTLVVLLSEDGRLIVWNPAFDSFKQSLYEMDYLRDFLSLASRTIFDLLLSTVTHERINTQGELELGQGNQLNAYNCFLYPVSNGRVIFVAEPSHAASDLETLSDELQKPKQSWERMATDLRAVLSQASRVSDTDALTSLPNRRQIMVELQDAIAFSDRFGTPLNIQMLDIDHFKRINDTHGHTIGDEALRTLAGRLRELTRPPETIGRCGGEEFLIVLPHYTLQSAIEYASRLCEQVRTLSIPVHELQLSVTVSVGVAQHKARGEGWRALLNRADQALSLAKEKGRDCWMVNEA